MAAPMTLTSGCFRQFLIHQKSIFKHHVRFRGNTVKDSVKPLDKPKSFVERLKELNNKDNTTDEVINIGFKLQQRKIDISSRTKKVKESKVELEKLARYGQLQVDLDDVKQEWLQESSTMFFKNIAEHFGIFKDLFNNAIFYPSVPMAVYHDYNEELVTPIFTGNIITPKEAASAPHVEFDSSPDSLWTLLMTAPDSHLQDNEAEYVHWLIGNIPGNDISKGEELFSYIQPFPVKGTGFHRYVFILFKQEKVIDFSNIKKTTNSTSLTDRTFSTLEFYGNLQDDITPAGLNFYQCEYDDSVRNVFWDIFDMKEPSYEFMHPPPYHPKQKKYPHREPFNLYLDRYRDKKDIREEVLVEKLKNTSPFKPREPESKYPLLHVFPKGPMWLRLKNRHKSLREMQWKDLD